MGLQSTMGPVVCVLLVGAFGCQSSVSGRVDSTDAAVDVSDPPDGVRDPGWANVPALAAPPFAVEAPHGWQQEHLAFVPGARSRVVGGPARWAIGGGGLTAGVAAELASQPYTGETDGDVWLWVMDQGRHLWRVEHGMAWPIAGSDDQGSEDGAGDASSFMGAGAYGGSVSVVGAARDRIWVNDNGLRRIERGPDGAWQVVTVGGGGTSGAAEGVQLRDVDGFGPSAVDASGNVVWTRGGNVWRAGADGVVHSVISRADAQADLAAIYDERWPGKAAPDWPIGYGESCAVVPADDGSIYFGGRTQPQVAKVTADGRYVPVLAYGPDGMRSTDWRTFYGTVDPALTEMVVVMGFAVVFGKPLVGNELPNMIVRVDGTDRMSVFKSDGTFGMGADDGDARFATENLYGFAADGSIQMVAPRGAGWTLVRLRPPS